MYYDYTNDYVTAAQTNAAVQDAIGTLRKGGGGLEPERIKKLIELPGGPAFAEAEGKVVLASAEAEALGICRGCAAPTFLKGLDLPGAGLDALETRVRLGNADWRLRVTAEEDCLLCFLRPEPPQAAVPNENTLLYASGAMRLALQDLSAALAVLAETPGQEENLRAQSQALRSVYRLRLTAERLELFSRLRTGNCRPEYQETAVVSGTVSFLGEIDELLRTAGLSLRWELPRQEFTLRLDWKLITTLLRELIANAAADTADGCIQVKLARAGERGLHFSVRNRPTSPLPKLRFDLHAARQEALRPGMGLGLSLVSTGAAAHGGSLLLSAEQDGEVTALLSVTAEAGSSEVTRSMLQLPTGAEANLLAFSPVLPPEVYLPELLF